MALPKKKCPKCEEGAADWLLTYGDMTTLLLTFFIMLLTSATVDGQKLKLILSAFPGLGMYQGEIPCRRESWPNWEIRLCRCLQ